MHSHGCTAKRSQLVPRACRSNCKVQDTMVPHQITRTAATTIFYRTEKSGAWLHVCHKGEISQKIPMRKVVCAPGYWLKAELEMSNPVLNDKHFLEFHMTDEDGDGPVPAGGETYIIPGPGRYTLDGGAVHKVAGPAVLLVSDLDGTMVGNDDEATEAFKCYWRDVGVTRGGVLVYNTGRSMSLFQQLVQEKSHCLATPDILITGVGTRIHTNQDGEWVEDTVWTRLLSEQWSVEAALKGVQKAMELVEPERLFFRIPEDQSEHKISIQLHMAELQLVLTSIEEALAAAGVTATIITSWHGDQRVLDILPINAGKMNAMQYVQKQYGFPNSRTVTCGDAGNDILMLSGENPAIVVGNAQPDLRNWLEGQQHKEQALAASGLPRLVVAKTHEARGILEGLNHLGLL